MHMTSLLLLILALGPSDASPAVRFDLSPKSFNLSLGDTLLASSKGDPLVALLYSDSPDIWQARSWRMIGPDEERISATNHGWSYGADSFEGISVQMSGTAKVCDQTGEISWRLSLENHAPGTVVGMIGPCLRWVQDLPEGFLVLPNRPGHKIKDPWAILASQVQHLQYPVPASMQYMAYSGAGGGIAIHVLDQDMRYKELAFGGPGRVMSFVQYPFAPPGGRWEAPVLLWQVLRTDWHEAADTYRDWFRGWARRPRVSPEIRAMPFVPGVVILARPVEDAFLKDVTKTMEKGTYRAAYPDIEKFAQSGLNGIHIVGWFGQGHDSTYPDHWPSEAMGGEQGLINMARKIHDEKMLAIYYLNARLLNVNSDSYKQHPEWALVTQEGKPREERIGGEGFHVACPSSKGYQEHLKGEVLRVATRYAGDGVQLDQIGAAWSALCFDSSHGHDTPSTCWAPGYVGMLKDIYASVRKVNPDFLCWIEGAWDGAGQYVDLSQGGFWPDHPGSTYFPEMSRYTLPDHPLFGDASIGGVPYWCPTDIGRAMRINPQAGEFFWKGEFRDNIGLSVAAPGEAHWFRKGKQALIVVFNPKQEDKSFQCSLVMDEEWTRQPSWTVRSLAAGTEAQAQVQEGRLVTEAHVPARQLEAVLLTPGQ